VRIAYDLTIGIDLRLQVYHGSIYFPHRRKHRESAPELITCHTTRMPSFLSAVCLYNAYGEIARFIFIRIIPHILEHVVILSVNDLIRYPCYILAIGGPVIFISPSQDLEHYGKVSVVYKRN